MCNWQGKVCSWLSFYLSQFLRGAIPISQYPGKQGFTSGKNLYLTVSQTNIFIQKINVSNL